MAIEIIAKPKIKIPIWAIILFIFCLLGFAILGFYYWRIDSLSKNIQNEIEEKEKALEKTESERKLEGDIFSKEEKINSFANLLSAHAKIFNIFPILESLTHPEVQFVDFNFTSATNKLNLKGNAKSFVALGQQILILKQEKKIKEINLSGISIRADGRIDFSLSLTFDAGTFE
jgi:hypothetical protein